MRSFLSLLVLVPASGFLSGCGEAFLQQETSQAFNEGYSDGCRNGSSAASNLTGESVRDEARYNTDPEYARGWLNGNRVCNGQNLNLNPNTPSEPIDIDGPI